MREENLKKYIHLKSNWAVENNIAFKNATLDSKNKYFWNCSKGHLTKKSIHAFNAFSCTVCSGREAEPGVTDFSTTHPYLKKLWDYEKNDKLKIENFKAGAKKKVSWKCELGHSYSREIYVQVRYEGRCPVCTNKKIVSGVNDLITKFPELAKMWSSKNIISPTTVSPNSAIKVLWECELGHDFERAIFRQTEGVLASCPKCPKPLKNSMKDAYLKDLLWDDPRSPIFFAPKSNKVVRWKCLKGHTFYDSPKKVTYRKGICLLCFPPLSSIPEELVKEFLLSKEYKFESNERILKGKEIDIHLASLNKGIEVNGEHWHSDSQVSRKTNHKTAESYHKEKVKLSKSLNIELAFVWTHDIKSHPEVFIELEQWLDGKKKLKECSFINRLTSIKDLKCKYC